MSDRPTMMRGSLFVFVFVFASSGQPISREALYITFAMQDSNDLYDLRPSVHYHVLIYAEEEDIQISWVERRWPLPGTSAKPSKASTSSP